MEIIHADVAYANSLIARRNARHLMFTELAVYFNNCINKAAADGKTYCIIRWRDFDENEDLATDNEATIELIDNIIVAGYEVAFCYNSSTAFNPCGIVIGWGKEAKESIDIAFAETEGELYKGE